MPAQPSLAKHTRETLAALPRRQLQALAKKHNVKANKKSDDIIDELVGKPTPDVNIQPQALNEIRVNSTRQAPNPEAPRETRKSKRRRTEVKIEDDEVPRPEPRRILRERAAPRQRRAPTPFPPPASSPAPGAESVARPLQPAAEIRVPRPLTRQVPARNELPLEMQLGFNLYHGGIAPMPIIYGPAAPVAPAGPSTPPNTSHPFAHGSGSSARGRCDKENDLSEEEFDKENIEPPQPARFGARKPLAALEEHDQYSDPASDDLELAYPDSPIATYHSQRHSVSGPSHKGKERARSFSPSPRPHERDNMPSRFLLPQQQNNKYSGVPVSNKDVRQLRRECTDWANELAKTTDELDEMDQVLASIRDTVDQSKKMLTEKIVWKLCATEDNILSKAKTNPSILDGTGHMEREEDNQMWRAIMKKRWEAKQLGGRGQKRLREEDPEESEDDMYL